MLELKKSQSTAADDGSGGNLPMPINLLLVDDRPDGLLALEAVLKSHDYKLFKAASAKEALSLLKKEDFAMVLLDVQMPEMDGFTMAEIMGKEEKLQEIPILFITAIDTDKSRVHKGYAAGAVDYLFKPFDSYILQSKVSVFAELYRRKRAIKTESAALIEHERLSHRKNLALNESINLHRYRSLANAIPHMIWRASPEGQVHYLNHSWHEYTGLTFEESWDTGWGAVIEPEDLGLLLHQWNHARVNKCESSSECRLKRASDGMYRWHYVRIVPELDSQEKLVGWICTWTDIHDRKLAEEELQKLCAQLENRVEERTQQLIETNKALEDEVNQRKRAQEEILLISEREQKRIGQDLHDGLAQQIAGIMFMCKTLHGKLEKKGIMEAAEVNTLLNLAKKSVEQAKAMARTFYPIELERLGFRGAIEDLALNTTQVFQVKCECRWLSPVNIQDPVVATHLFRIAQEAIHNSIKYGKASLIEIIVEENDGKNRFIVRDNGIGLPKEPQPATGKSSMGLKIMDYRARMLNAEFKLQSRSDCSGAEIMISWAR